MRGGQLPGSCAPGGAAAAAAATATSLPAGCWQRQLEEQVLQQARALCEAAAEQLPAGADELLFERAGGS